MGGQKPANFAGFYFRNWITYCEFCEVHFRDGQISKVPGGGTTIKQLTL